MLEFVTGNVTNVYYAKRKLAINMQIFAVSEVSGGPYCNRNVNSGTETCATNLILIWQLVITSNSPEFSACFILLQIIYSRGLYTIQW